VLVAPALLVKDRAPMGLLLLPPFLLAPIAPVPRAGLLGDGPDDRQQVAWVALGIAVETLSEQDAVEASGGLAQILGPISPGGAQPALHGPAQAVVIVKFTGHGAGMLMVLGALIEDLADCIGVCGCAIAEAFSGGSAIDVSLSFLLTLPQ